MEKIRVLQIVPSLGFANGVAGVVMNWYREIDKNKIQFDFLSCYNRDKTFEEEIKKLGGKVYNLPFALKNPFSFFSAARKFFKENKYQVIHSHITQYNFFFFPMAKFYGVKKIILHSHNPKYSDNKIKNFLAGAMLSCVKNFADVKIACSKKAGDFLFGENADYIMLNNAVDCNKFAFNPVLRKEVRSELGIGEDVFLIGHIGRFCEQKNHSFLIDVFNEVYKRNKSAKLMLAGIGPLEENIKEKVKNLGLSDKVYFLGIYDKPQKLYQAFDVFVLPSLYEGLPVVGVEAQAAGLLCFFSDTITREVLLIPQTKMLSLGDLAVLWADKIIQESSSFNRYDTSELIEKAGFGMKNVVNKIISVYGTKE